jgi:hypothetical protein
MTTLELATVPEGALLYQLNPSGRLVVVRNDQQEIAFIHLVGEWYYFPPSWHWRGGRATEFRVAKPLPVAVWDLKRVA